MANEFYALMGRMRYISRWGLMRNSIPENLQEHSYQTAMLAHALALIRRNILHLPCPDPDRCAVAALYHDASEILTGDLPTPIKYYNSEIRNAYKAIEETAGNRLLDTLPSELRKCYEADVLENDPDVTPIVKAADKLSAHIKCIEEQKNGNTEFDSAAGQTLQALKDMHREELEWFLENCLEPFCLNLDQL